jgi:ABC-type lipoprotein release transport system permease subunit
MARARFAAPVAVCAFLVALLASAAYADVQGAFKTRVSDRALLEQEAERVVTIKFERAVEGFIVLNTTIQRSLPFRRPGAPRYIEVPLQLVFEVSGEDHLVVSVPRDVRKFTLSGPFSRNNVLVPYVAFFDDSSFVNSSEVTLEWPVEQGFRVKFEVLPLLDGSYPRLSVEAPGLVLRPSGPYGLRALTPNEQLLLSSMVPELYFSSSSVVLPPQGEVKVIVSAFIGDSVAVFEEVFTPTANGTAVVSDVAEEVVKANRARLASLFANVSSLLNSLKSSGYYLGGSEALLSLAEKAARSRGGGLLEEAYGQRLAYTLLSQLGSRLYRLIEGPSFAYAISLAVVNLLLSMLIGWLAFERNALRWALSLLLFSAFTALSPVLLPKLKIEVAAIVALAAVSGVLFAARAIARAKPVQRVRTASGASLEGLASSTVSFAVSFLSKRKVRAILLLVTVLSISLGVTCLTSFSTYSAVNRQEAGIAQSNVRSTNLVARGSSPASPLNTVGLGFLSGRIEVSSLAPSAVAFYPVNPLDTVNGMPISGVVGVSHGSPLSEMLQSIIVEGSTRDLRSGAMIVSDALARQVGKRVGDTLSVRGYEFKIVGIFDSKALTNLKDLDGEDLIPTVVMGMSSYRAPSEGVIFLYYGDALLLGAYTNKVYVELTPSANAEELAESLSLLGGVNVYVAEPGKQLKVFYPGFRVEVIGAELAVPAVIALLIVFSAFAGFTYEVRRDIFTLSTLGATPDQVFLVFTTLATVVGFAGGAIGYLSGMAAFRALNLAGASIPVDVKVDLPSLVFSVAVSVALALAGALAPASKAVVAAVPSLKRRWTPEAEEAERNEAGREIVLLTPIPVVIRSAEKAKEFVDFVEAKLSELAAQKVSVYNVEKYVESEHSLVVYFEYLQVEGRAFKSYNKLRVRRLNGTYSVELESKIVTIYTMFAKECLKDVASLVRKLTLEWRAEEK